MMAEKYNAAMKRNGVLMDAQDALIARGKNYGPVVQNFKDIADLFLAATGVQIAPHEVGIFMMCVKLARLKESPKHYDSYVDLAGYAHLTHIVSETSEHE
jgi:hypothetical protein